MMKTEQKIRSWARPEVGKGCSSVSAGMRLEWLEGAIVIVPISASCKIWDV